jgi:SHS2 domain-containing protein
VKKKVLKIIEARAGLIDMRVSYGSVKSLKRRWRETPSNERHDLLVRWLREIQAMNIVGSATREATR